MMARLFSVGWQYFLLGLGAPLLVQIALLVRKRRVRLPFWYYSLLLLPFLAWALTVEIMQYRRGGTMMNIIFEPFLVGLVSGVLPLPCLLFPAGEDTVVRRQYALAASIAVGAAVVIGAAFPGLNE